MLQPGRVGLGRGGRRAQVIRLPGPSSIGYDEMIFKVSVASLINFRPVPLCGHNATNGLSVVVRVSMNGTARGTLVGEECIDPSEW